MARTPPGRGWKGILRGSPSEGAAGGEFAAEDGLDGAIEGEAAAADGTEGAEDAAPGGAADGRGIAEFARAGLEDVAVAEVVAAAGEDDDVEVEVDEIDGSAEETGGEGGVALRFDEATPFIEEVEGSERGSEADDVDGEGGVGVARGGRRFLVAFAVVEDDEPVIAAGIDEVAGPFGAEGAVVLQLADEDRVRHELRHPGPGEGGV